MTPASSDERSRLERWLGAFADVRAGEGRTVLLLALNVFLILMAYYVLKPVREALILGEGSAELKSYMSAVQVFLLALVVPAYGWLVSRLPRMQLINLVTGFFAACLIAFFLAAQVGLPIAVIFFLWIGIFNLMIVAQFWSFANDVYTKEEGERLFAIVGFGASLGAVVGARMADRLIEPLGINLLLLLGGALLVGEVLLTNRIDRREKARRPEKPKQAGIPDASSDSGTSAFAMVFRSQYLLLIAIMLMVLNLVNTTGEYILGSIVEHTATEMVSAGGAGGLSKEQLIGDFYSK
jgi:AAA family ATP:ADP antiporter